MTSSAESLAKQFDEANSELISLVERCSDQQWQASCRGEDWSVGVTAHHVAGGHEALAGMVQLLASGQPLPPLTAEMLDQMNAQHAQQYATCGRAETIELLRKNGAAAGSIVRALSDEQLGRSAAMAMAGGAPVSAHQMIENVLIGHAREHTASIRAALGE
jgi:hypothetical protein